MEKSSSAGSRQIYLDTVGGILLIHMIVGHCCMWSQTYKAYQEWTFWLNFFMPWFFFKAGMFFKLRPLKEELKKSFRRLMIPYIYFSIIGTLLLWVKLIICGEFSFGSILSPIKSVLVVGATPGNLALWFLLGLFVVRLLFSIIYSKFVTAGSASGKCLWGGVFSLVCGAFIPVHYLIALNDIPYPWWLSNMSSGMLFFAIGYWLRNFRPNKVLSVGLLISYVLIMWFYPTVVVMFSGELVEGMYLLWIPTAVIGILSANSVFCNFLYFPNFFSKIGAQTLPYYCMHWCVKVVVSIFFVTEQGIPNISYLIALIIANIVILPIMTYLIRHSRYSYIIQ